MADWYPNAVKVLGNDAGTFYPGYAKKGVLHTTEGGSIAGAEGAYRSSNSWPHFTVGQDGTVHQHVSISRAARSLQNAAGGVETNRGGAIQIEVVGYASKPSWPAAQVNAMKGLMRWIEANTGIRQYGPKFSGSGQAGLRNTLEFSNAYWTSFNGWCGHQHVPENSHWDPGAIELILLFSAPLPTPTPTPPTPVPPSPTPFTVPASYFTEVTQVPFTLKRAQGGYIVVGGDGGVFTYDGAPFKGSLGGVALNRPIIAGTFTGSGEGYLLMDADGAIFGFGDAQYAGGWNSLPSNVKGTRKPMGVVASGTTGYKILTLDPSNDGSPFDAYGFGAY